MGLFNRTINPKPPYDALEREQRLALYYLLEYFAMKGVDMLRPSNVFNYLDKAANKLGFSEKQIKEYRPFFNTFEKVTSYVKQIKNRQALEYTICNCGTIFNLMNDYTIRQELAKKLYELYNELGYSEEEVNYYTRRYILEDIM